MLRIDEDVLPQLLLANGIDIKLFIFDNDVLPPMPI